MGLQKRMEAGSDPCGIRGLRYQRAQGDPRRAEPQGGRRFHQIFLYAGLPDFSAYEVRVSHHSVLDAAVRGIIFTLTKAVSQTASQTTLGLSQNDTEPRKHPWRRGRRRCDPSLSSVRFETAPICISHPSTGYPGCAAVKRQRGRPASWLVPRRCGASCSRFPGSGPASCRPPPGGKPAPPAR